MEIHSLSKQYLKLLAESDESELVSEVHEYFVDYLALSPFLFIVDHPVSLNNSKNLITKTLTRSTEVITSVLLSLKKVPIIRYQHSSDAARQLAESVRSTVAREAALFDFRQTNSKITILILDRVFDPVTPLLNQWTYEAMIHELIGIRHNRVSIFGPAQTESKDIVLSAESDDFFKANQYSNFGEIGLAIKTLVDEFQASSKLVEPKSVESIQDLKKFFDNYPAFRKASGTVETHVTLMTELSRIVREHALLDVSEAEQQLVCQDDHSASLNRIRSLLTDPRVRLTDAVRLVLLYSIKYSAKKKEITSLTNALVSKGASDETVHLIDLMQKYANLKNSQFPNGTQSTTNSERSNVNQVASKAVASLTKRLVKGLKGVENIYSQHEPELVDLLNKMLRDQLREPSFPYVATHQAIGASEAPKDVMIFVIGGASYEEAVAVHKMNVATPGLNIYLGSTCMHNSRSFMDEVMTVMGHQLHEAQGSQNESISRFAGFPTRSGGAVKYELLR
ncbi:vacuolar protein sorting-associated protein 45 [Cichlidogyrus casuarinus]|uniref:Vacuolar protein sorting-associated protein 45 n=1 Tax=Cichlidogyrus casuarinus TaxID=1844966 RepID=A0ABD2QP27_9PLAT